MREFQCTWIKLSIVECIEMTIHLSGAKSGVPSGLNGFSWLVT